MRAPRHDGALHRAAIGAELDGVVDHVGQGAGQQGAVAQAGRRVWRGHRAHVHIAVAGQGPEVVGGFGEQGSQVQRRHAVWLRLRAGQLYKTLGHAQRGPRVTLNALQQLLVRQAAGVGALHFQERQDGRVGRADVVRDEVHRLVTLLQCAAHLGQVHQGQQPACIGQVGERLALHQQAAALGVRALGLLGQGAMLQGRLGDDWRIGS